jgi:type II secretory pathway pseudopilin PulG
MKHKFQSGYEAGFSLMELLISMMILIPIMGAALSMFSVGVNQQVTEQGSVDVNQEARAGLEMMTREIGQAGAHGNIHTTASAAISASQTVQTVSVGSTTGMTVGEWVDVGADANWECVKLTAVSGNTISGIFTMSHAANASVNLFAYPYLTAVIPPNGMGPNASVNTTTLRFFGDIDNDLVLDYVEYVYNSATDRITRSVTPVTAGSKSAAVPFINNIRDNSAQFTVNSNALGVITSVNISFTVENTVESNAQKQHVTLASRALVPSAMAATNLLKELRMYQDINKLPLTPPQVIAWAHQGET